MPLGLNEAPDVHYVIFGAAVWALVIVALAVHVVDVYRRARAKRIMLGGYGKPRPIEWMLAGLLVCAVAGVALTARGVRLQDDAVLRLQLLLGGLVTVAALAYMGARGASWLVRDRDQFLSSPGATGSEDNEVWVDLELEAQGEAARMRGRAFPIYAAGCLPLLLATLGFTEAVPFGLQGGIIAVVLGGMLVWVLTLLPGRDEEDAEW